ncbi:MAG: type II secretion system F family protein [Butyrivibrio sp.]|nr:type II secretion system F family protein [Acetatifactor muris]MCM1559514.1 type II secretion system F family protein [Butyrivibrio sp.]
MKGVLWGDFIKKERFFGKTSLEPQDYHRYHWKRRERACAVLASAAVTAFAAYFFYKSPWAILPLLPVGVVFFRKIRRGKGEREREELTEQFRECILAVSTLLGAGYSVENAFLECEQDMVLMYGKDALICRELTVVRRGMNINVSLEELLADFGERSGCEEMVQFAEVFAIAKRSGGNLAEIIRSSAELIGRKAELKREVDTLLSGKRMELNIMKLMPFAILAYVGSANPGYFDILYAGLQGRLIMTGCLGAYIGAWILGELVIRRMKKEWNC